MTSRGFRGAGGCHPPVQQEPQDKGGLQWEMTRHSVSTLLLQAASRRTAGIKEQVPTA